MRLKQKKDDQVKDTDSQKEPVLDTQKEPILERKSSKVSFDEPIETKRKDSYTGVTRVSFEKPADLYVTSSAEPATTESAVAETAEVTAGATAEVTAGATAEQPAAAAEVKTADASNTGTAKRKSKKKRDEVCGKQVV